MDKQQYISIIEKIKEPDAYLRSDEIMDAYEKLDEMGSYEMRELKMDYLRGTLKSPMREIFQNYLFGNDKAREELKELRNRILATRLLLKDKEQSSISIHAAVEKGKNEPSKFDIPKDIGFIASLQEIIASHPNVAFKSGRSAFKFMNLDNAFDVLAKDEGLEEPQLEKIKEALLLTINNMVKKPIPFKEFIVLLKKEFEKLDIDLKHFKITIKILSDIIEKLS
jgi:hypothetical protein